MLEFLYTTYTLWNTLTKRVLVEIHYCVHGLLLFHITDPIQILQHWIEIIKDTSMKILKTKSGSVTYSVWIDGSIIKVEWANFTSWQHTPSESLYKLCGIWWSHMHQCREAATKAKTPRTLLVQGPGEVNGQSCPTFCQPNSARALSDNDQPVFRRHYARKCKPLFFKTAKHKKRRIHPESTSYEDSHVFRPVTTNKYEGDPADWPYLPAGKSRCYLLLSRGIPRNIRHAMWPSVVRNVLQWRNFSRKYEWTGKGGGWGRG